MDNDTDAVWNKNYESVRRHNCLYAQVPGRKKVETTINAPNPTPCLSVYNKYKPDDDANGNSPYEAHSVP